MSSKKCFVIASIGDPEFKTRELSDLVFEYVIAPVTKDCGYEEDYCQKVLISL